MRTFGVVLLGIALAAPAYAGKGSAKCRAEAVVELAEAAGWREAYQASVASSFGDGFFPATGMTRTPDTEAFVVQWWLPRLQGTFDQVWAVIEPEAHAWWAERMTCRELQDATAAIQHGTTAEEDAAMAALFTGLIGEYETWVRANLERWIAPFTAQIQGIVVESAPAFVAEAQSRGYLPTPTGDGG